MKGIKRSRFLMLLSATAVLAAILAVAPGVALAGTTVTYDGKGFTFDGTTYLLNSERCNVDDDANDGSTGQFANLERSRPTLGGRQRWGVQDGAGLPPLDPDRERRDLCHH